MRFRTHLHKHSRATHPTQGGFTLLFSVLVASIILAVGIAIFNITIKEIRLSSIARESHSAFYAADTGTECALYHDLQNDAFGTSTTNGATINCNGEQHAISTADGAHPSGDWQYRRSFTVSFSDGRCARVGVRKFSKSQGEAPYRTRIASRGYNTGYDASNDRCTTPSPQKVERGLLLEY